MEIKTDNPEALRMALAFDAVRKLTQEFTINPETGMRIAPNEKISTIVDLYSQLFNGMQQGDRL